MTCNEQNDKINENAMHENKLRFKIDPSIESMTHYAETAAFNRANRTISSTGTRSGN